MNIYGSLMDIFDEKTKDIYDEKQKFLTKTYTFMTSLSAKRKKQTPIFKRIIPPMQNAR